MPHSRLMRNVSAEAGARILYLATRFFIPPFVIAHVGMQAYGLYGTVFILVAYFGVSAIGFSNAYVKYVAQYAAAGETDRANRLLSSGFTISSVLGLLGFAGVVALWPVISVWMKVPPAMASDGRFLTLIITGVFFTYLALSVYRDVLTGLQEIALVQKVWIGSFVVESALIFGLVGVGLGLRALGIAFLARTAVDLAAQWWLATRRVSWLRIRFQMPDRESLRLLASFGGIVQVNCMLAIFLNSVERVVATPLLGLEASGLLDLGKRFPGMASSVPSAFASSVMPSAAGLSASDPGALRSLYLSTVRYMNAVSGVLFAFLAFAAWPCLVFWLGKVPAGAAELTIVFAVATQIHLSTGPGSSILKAAGSPAMEFHYSVANCLALAITLPLSRWWFGHWDVLGIAIATAGATMFSASWFLGRAHRRLGIAGLRFFRECVLPGLMPWVTAAICIAPFAAWSASGDRMRAAIGLTLGGILYLAVTGVVMLRFAATTTERDSILLRLGLSGLTLFGTRFPANAIQVAK